MLTELSHIPISIVRKRIKHLYVRMNRHTGEVTVSAPHHVPLAIIEQHLFIKKEWIKRQHQRILVQVTLSPPMQPPIISAQAKTLFHTQVAHLIQHWEKIIKVRVNSFCIRSMTTRWGSCNTLKKRITINLNLIHKPLPCLEYVIVHELIHLIIPNHSQRFYSLMEHFMPEWKIIKKQLEATCA
ncbi:MAG: M48 family metallopeptidase [Legionellaceae bacterium]